MKNKRKIKVISCSFVAIMLFSIMFSMRPVYAGISTSTIDTSTYEDELSGTDWFNNDNDVLAQDGVIVFPDTSSEMTKLISNEIVRHSQQLDKILETKFTLQFTSLPEGEQFAFVVGMQSLTSDLSDRGNIELLFSNTGGVYNAMLQAYSEDGIPTSLVKNFSCGGGKVKVLVEVYSNQKIKVTLGGKTVYNGTVPVTGEGSYGFLQTGACGAKVSDFVIKSYRYDIVEAPDFEEDFETGYFNANVLYSKVIQGSSYSPRTMGVESFGDNKAFYIQNMGMSYIGTTYAYSNFEFTFDVVYSQKTPKADENGNIISPINDPFGLAFGSDGVSHGSHEGYTTASNMFVINSSGGVYTTKAVNNKADGKFASESGLFSIRLTVLDGVITLEMKELNEKNYQVIYKYDVDETPTGNVLIWIPSGCTGAWAFDNFKLVNKDEGLKDITVEYKSSKIEPPADFEYEPLGYDYNPDKTVEADISVDKFEWIPVAITAGGCILILALVYYCAIVKKGRRGNIHEEQ